MKPLLKIGTFIRPYWIYLAGAFIALVGVTATQLAIPTIIGQVIDVGIEAGEVTYMFNAALLILAIGVVRAVIAFLQRYFSEIVSIRVAFDVRNRLFSHIQNLSFSFHDHNQTGQLMSRCTEDVRAIQQFIGSGIVELAQIILLLIGTITLMILESPKLTLFALAPLIPLLFITADFGGRVSKLFYSIEKALGELSSKLQENVTGVQVVRAFTREGHQIDRFDRSNKELYEARVHVISEWSKIMPTTNFLIAAGTILILWFGGQMVIDGQLTIGQIVQFNAYMLLIASPAQQLTWQVNAAGEAAAGSQRIFEILDHEPIIQSPQNPISAENLSGKVEFKNVEFTYQGESEPALSEINFTALPNQTIALIGATGSGKTSLINLLPRFYDTSAGEVLFDGVDVRDYDLYSLRRQIGIVLQSSLLFSATIQENIAFGMPDASSEEVAAAAKAAQADEFITSFPDGYQTVVGERGVTLSGGQRQRVAIARALLINPRFLILDNSTSSVDTETEHLIQLALDNLMKDRTTFIIAQRLSSVRTADLILVLDHGKIAERGTHQELIETGGLYKEIHRLQLTQHHQAQADLESCRPGGEMSMRKVKAEQMPSLPAHYQLEDEKYEGYNRDIFQGVFSFITPYKRELIISMILMIIGSAGSVAGPYLTKIAIDEGIDAGNISVLRTTILLYLAIVLVQWGVTYIRINLMARAGQSAIYDMRARLFKYIQQLSMSFFSHYSVGRLISRVINDVSVLRQFVTWAIVASLRNVLTLFGIIFAMLSLNLRLSLFTFAVIPLIFAATFVFRKLVRELYRNVRAGMSWVNSVLAENINGVRVIQAFSREEYNYNQFNNTVNRFQLIYNLKVARLVAIFFPSIDMIGTLATFLVIWLGGAAVIGEQVTAGVLVAFVLYIESFFRPIQDLSRRYDQFQSSMIAGERILDLLGTPVEIQDQPNAQPPPADRGSGRI